MRANNDDLVLIPVLAIVFAAAVLLTLVTIGCAGSPKYSPPLDRVGSISLRELETRIKEWMREGHPSSDPPSLGGLGEIHGYRWNRENQDLELIGAAASGSTAPIGADAFATALRVALNPAIGVTLLPTDPADRDSVHTVVVFPPEIAGTSFTDSLIWGDYMVKRLALGDEQTLLVPDLASLTHEFLNPCAVSPESIRELSAARLFFVPEPPVLELEHHDAGYTIWIRQADVRLEPEAGLGLSDDPPQLRDGQADPALQEFARSFNRNLPELEAQYPILGRLHATYRLALVATLLRASDLPYDLGFWLDEYPIPAHETPREFPRIKGQTVKRTCWGQPYEYTATTHVREVWGGVLITYASLFSNGGAARADQLPFSLGTALGSRATSGIIQVPTWTRPPTLPRAIRSAIPRTHHVLPTRQRNCSSLDSQIRCW